MEKFRIETLLYNAIMGLYDENYSQDDVIRLLDMTAKELISVTYPQYKKQDLLNALELFDEYDAIMNVSPYMCNNDLEIEKLHFSEYIANKDKDFIERIIQNLRDEITERRPVGRYGCYDFNSEREIETLISKLQGRM